jgi:hypothetical protein
MPVFSGDVSAAIGKYHSFYEEETKNGDLELLDVQLRNSLGQETEVLEPGEEMVLEIRLRAKSDIQNAHTAILIHTEEGQLVFDTATSRLLDKKKLNLRAGEVARIVFTLNMNLRSGLFLLGLTVTPEIEVPGEFIYYNGAVKRVVMAGERKSNGVVYLNPRAEVCVE